MKLTNLPGGLKMSHGPSGQPRLNAVSMAPRVRVGKNLKLWLGNQPQHWSLTHELPSGDWSSDPIREKPTRNSWRQANKVVWADLPFLSFSILRHGSLEWMWEYSTFMLVYHALHVFFHISVSCYYFAQALNVPRTHHVPSDRPTGRTHCSQHQQPYKGHQELCKKGTHLLMWLYLIASANY